MFLVNGPAHDIDEWLDRLSFFLGQTNLIDSERLDRRCPSFLFDHTKKTRAWAIKSCCAARAIIRTNVDLMMVGIEINGLRRVSTETLLTRQSQIRKGNKRI